MDNPNDNTPIVQPLSRSHRSFFFYLLVTVFCLSLPFLFLYATGYRLNMDGGSLISTGGMYVAAERTGAEIYIDNELVRETRAFRRAFYAQSLDPGTHRVHVQKDGHHTWVKELPVYQHLVTEAQAFNLPLIPSIRIISPWKNSLGETLLTASSTLVASTTNQVAVSTSTKSTARVADTEFVKLLELFVPSTATSTEIVSFKPFSSASTTSEQIEVATTTKEYRGFRLHEIEGDVFVTYFGPRENMPYYYCAEDFELLGTSTTPRLLPTSDLEAAALLSENLKEDDELLIHPVQEVTEDAVCSQTIKIDRKGQLVTSFDFFPGSTDLVIVALEDGVYVVEVDDRSWQNSQPLLLGGGFDVRVENGGVYVYDDTLIYQVLLES